MATLTDAFPDEGMADEGRFFVFAEADDEACPNAALPADSEVSLEAPAPGLFQGADLNYPVVLHMTNDTNCRYRSRRHRGLHQPVVTMIWKNIPRSATTTRRLTTKWYPTPAATPPAW
jgi:hypothetical protein